MTLENILESFWTPSFWPHEAIFEVRIKPSCDYTFTAGPDLMCPSSSASNSDDFPFFWILSRPFGSRVSPIKSWIENLRYLRNLQCGAVAAGSGERRRSALGLMMIMGYDGYDYLSLTSNQSSTNATILIIII